MKIYIKIVLLFIISLCILIGCGYKPHPKAYMCISKPPMKITYIDYHRDINACVVNAMISKVADIPYKNIKLNESNTVSINYDVEGTHKSETLHSFTLKSK